MTTSEVGNATLGPGRGAEEAQRFADGAVPAPPLVDGAVADRLVALLVARRDADKLGLLAAKGEKTVAKAARKGLHLLRTKGMDAPAPRAEVAAQAPLVMVGEGAEAFATAPDGGGNRLVSVIKPAPSGGFDMVHVQLSDEGGILDVALGSGPRKIWRSLRRRFEEQHVVAADVTVAYAASVVEEAYQKTRSLKRSPPGDYAAAKSILGPARLLAADEHPALTEVVPAASFGRDDALSLHRLPDLSAWIPSRKVLESLALKFDEISTSTILVDDRQRHEARNAAIGRVVAELFDGEARPRWRRRLLDAALVYAHAGHEDDAMKLRAQADLLANPAWDAAEDPFARELVEKIVAPKLRGQLVDEAAGGAGAAGAPAAEPNHKKIIIP